MFDPVGIAVAGGSGCFLEAGIDAGYRDDGASGLRTATARKRVQTGREDSAPDGCIDHLWIRVRDVAVSKRFHTTIAPHAGLRIRVDAADHRIRASGGVPCMSGSSIPPRGRRRSRR